MFNKEFLKNIASLIAAPIITFAPASPLEQNYNSLDSYADNSINHISYGRVVTSTENDPSTETKIGQRYLAWDGRTANATILKGEHECQNQKSVISAKHLLPSQKEIENTFETFLTISKPKDDINKVFSLSGFQLDPVNNLKDLRSSYFNGDFAMIYNLESEKCLEQTRNRLQNPDNTNITIANLKTTKNPHFEGKNGNTIYFNLTNQKETKSRLNPEINNYTAVILPLKISNFIINWYNKILTQSASKNMRRESLRVALIPKVKIANRNLNPVFLGVSGSPYFSQNNKIVGIQSKIFGSLFDDEIERKYTNIILQKVKSLCLSEENFSDGNKSACNFIKSINLDSMQLVFISTPFKQP